MTNAYDILVGKQEREGPLGRPKHRWEINVKIDLTEIGCEDVDWIHLTQDMVQ
jgi:3-oxoacyl-ACP reductase-like protein